MTSREVESRYAMYEADAHAAEAVIEVQEKRIKELEQIIADAPHDEGCPAGELISDVKLHWRNMLNFSKGNPLAVVVLGILVVVLVLVLLWV